MIICGRPWLFDRNVLVLKEVDENVPPTHMAFTQAIFWVQVHDMPLICMNREVGFTIGATLGRVEEVDVTSGRVGWGRCLRIRVLIDLTKPLDRGHALLLNGKSIWVNFKYEKLPQFAIHVSEYTMIKGPVKAEGGFKLNNEELAKQWGVWLQVDDLR
jgi:hypothetical protein